GYLGIHYVAGRDGPGTTNLPDHTSSQTDGESPLFVSRQGKKISVSAVGLIVKQFAEHAGLNGRFTAHSLRIGGATAAMATGISLTQIRAIGGWDSKA
ncbi:27510_t:CDS:2, partial [Racocetra persica]